MKWIDIKEKAPQDWRDVLIALDTGAVVVGVRGPMGWSWAETDDEGDLDATVTHWMPFPKHPTLL
jgi:hypothetical protein